MIWESDIMAKSAKLLLPSTGLRILNVGHGMGIIDTLFQAQAPSSHHIVEAHPAVIAELVCEDPQPLGFRIGGFQLALPSVLGDRLGRHVVEAAVQRMELIGRDFRFQLFRELGDRLTEVAIVVDDLADGEALLEEILGVVDCVRAHLRQRPLQLPLHLQCLNELIEEQRDAVLQLVVRRQRRQSRRKKKSPGRRPTEIKFADAQRYEAIYPEGIRRCDCTLARERAVWRLEDGRAVLVGYRIFAGPGGKEPRLTDVTPRCEYGIEILVVLAFLAYVIGLSLGKACAVLLFFCHLPLSRAQADALYQRQPGLRPSLKAILIAQAIDRVVHAVQSGLYASTNRASNRRAA